MNAELTLRDYIDIFRRRAWIVAACFVGAVALAFIWTALQTPQYRSTAEIRLNQNTANELFDPVTGAPTNQLDRQVANEVALVESQLVRDEAEASLGFEADISARAKSNEDTIVVTAQNADPERARLVAQTYAEAYLEVRRNEFIEERIATATAIRERIEAIQAEIDAAPDGTDTSSQQALIEELAESRDRLTIAAEIGNTGSARIINNAERANNPFSPNITRNLLLGGVLGLMLGAGAALLLESLDRSIKTRAVIEALTPGIAALVGIPRMNVEDEVVALTHPGGVESEAFRTLRAGIEFASVDQDLQVIQVTSPGASAGKTTIAANLATVMAQSGKTVAVVDADLRRPRLHTIFGLEQVPGFSSVIIDQAEWKQAAKALDMNNGRLSVCPSGPVPPGPSELLGSERALATINALRNTFDVIVIDSPPVLPVADALVISRFVDATVLVANAKRTRRDDVVRAVEQLDQAGANVIGTVLNQVSSRGAAGHGYGYGYGYAYGAEEGASGFFGRKRDHAPRLHGTATIDSDELPKFKAARNFARKAAPDSSVAAAASSAPRPGAFAAAVPTAQARAAGNGAAAKASSASHSNPPVPADLGMQPLQWLDTLGDDSPAAENEAGETANPRDRNAGRAKSRRQRAKAKSVDTATDDENADDWADDFELR